MQRIKFVLHRSPVIFSILIIAVLTFVSEVIPLDSIFPDTFDRQTASYLSGTILQGAFCILLVICISKLWGLKDAGFTGQKDWRQLWLIWPILPLILLMAWPLFDGTLTINTAKPLVITSYILVLLSTGFYEEILCRGLVLTLLLRKWGSTRKGIYLSVILSSLLFGLVHLSNFFLGRSSFLGSVTQVIFATFLGIFLAACILRNQSIWPAIVFHAIFNICGDLGAIAVGTDFGQVSAANSSLEEAVLSSLLCLPLLIYGLIILRKVDPGSKAEMEKRSSNA